jgi:nickel transport protein
MRQLAATSVLLLIFACHAQAHDLWIERQGSSHALHYGHERSAHEGAKKLEYKPGWVRTAACFNTAGKDLPAELRHGYPTTLKGDCATSWFLASSGYWSKTPYGSRNLPKTEAGPVLDSWLSVESVKRVDAWGEALARPLTRELEIVPLADPLRLKAGDKLRLAVYLAGKPATGATVAYFGLPRGVTGNDGQLNVRLKEAGLQLIQASLETPLADGKADRLVQATALQFEVAP